MWRAIPWPTLSLIACAAIACAPEARADAGGFEPRAVFDSSVEYGDENGTDDQTWFSNSDGGELLDGAADFSTRYQLYAPRFSGYLEGVYQAYLTPPTAPERRDILRYDSPSLGPVIIASAPRPTVDEPVLSTSTDFLLSDSQGRWGQYRVTVGATYEAYTDRWDIGAGLRYAFDRDSDGNSAWKVRMPAWQPLDVKLTDAGCPEIIAPEWVDVGGRFTEGSAGKTGVCTGRIEWRTLPLDQEIFTDGFESGDLSAWSTWQATR